MDGLSCVWTQKKPPILGGCDRANASSRRLAGGPIIKRECHAHVHGERFLAQLRPSNKTRERWTCARFVRTNGPAMEELWVPLMIRAVVTAAVVVAATAAAERVGPFWAALIGAFPTSAGPAYVMLALKADAALVAASAVSSLASMIAIAPFVVSLIFLAPRTNVFGTVGGGVVVWAVFAMPIAQIT